MRLEQFNKLLNLIASKWYSQDSNAGFLTLIDYYGSGTALLIVTHLFLPTSPSQLQGHIDTKWIQTQAP